MNIENYSNNDSKENINFKNLQNFLYKKWLLKNLKKIAKKWFYQEIPLDAIFIGTIRDMKESIQVSFKLNSNKTLKDIKFLKKESIDLYNKAVYNAIYQFQFSKMPKNIQIKNLALTFDLRRKDLKEKNILLISGLVKIDGSILFDTHY